MHYLKIQVADYHYDKLKHAQDTLKKNGFDNYTLSYLISEALRGLYMKYPGANPPKVDHLLFNKDGKSWKSQNKRHLNITLHPDVMYYVSMLLDCFSGITTNSQRVAAALEAYLCRDSINYLYTEKK